MNGCLRCISLDVEDLVTRFYVQLNLEPWDVYARRVYAENARSYMHEPERQTGRTTHNLLEMIAYCEKNHVETLGVSNLPMAARADRLIKALGAHVRPSTTIRGKTFTYCEDHYHG